MNLELTGQNPTWPILLGLAAVVAYFVLGKKNDPSASGTASSVAGLFSGNKLTAFMSFVALASQAGTWKERLRLVLGKAIEWSNNPPTNTPAITPKPEDETEK